MSVGLPNALPAQAFRTLRYYHQSDQCCLACGFGLGQALSAAGLCCSCGKAFADFTAYAQHCKSTTHKPGVTPCTGCHRYSVRAGAAGT